MAKIVFDIETIGFDFEKLPKDSQEYLLKYAQTPEEKKEIKEKTGLCPLTGEIVAICLLNPDTEKGKVFFQAPKKDIKPFIEDGIQYEPMDEKGILESFWSEIRNYQQFVTFNGRGFDCPYIYFRSAAQHIRPTKNLMPYRFDQNGHIDLADQLSFYGSFRRYSLNFYCKSLKLKACKTDGMDGGKVQEYFKDKKYEEIARYCADDVKATAELYFTWESYIRG